MARTKERRSRVSPDTVRENAKNAGLRGGFFLRLPKGVEQWEPEEKGTVTIDIVPYEVTTDVHPDKKDPKKGPNKGQLYYKRPFLVHRNVGPDNAAVVCPRSVGEKCPMCEKRDKLAKNYKENIVEIKAIQARKMVAFPILNPTDKDEIAVFVFGYGKFAESLEKELEEGPEENLMFWDTSDEGKTLSVRFTKETFDRSDFLQAQRIDFEDRDAMDEDELLTKVPNLDDCFVVPEYDDLKRLWLGADASDSSDDSPPERTTGGKTRNKPAKEDKEEKKADPEGPEYEVGDTVKFTYQNKELIGEIVHLDKGDVTVKHDVGGGKFKEKDIDIDDVIGKADLDDSSAGDAPSVDDEKGKPEPSGEIEVGSDVTFEDDGKDLSGTVLKIDKDGKFAVVDVGGEKQSVRVKDLTLADSTADAHDDAGNPDEYEPGQIVTVLDDDKEVEATIINIGADDKAKVKTEDGVVLKLALDEIVHAGPPVTTGKGGTKPESKKTEFDVGDPIVYIDGKKRIPGKVVKIKGTDITILTDEDGEKMLVDVEDIEPGEDAGGGTDADPEFEVGDAVTWDDGDESGKIVKIDVAKGRAKVKSKSGVESTIPLAKLGKKPK